MSHTPPPPPQSRLISSTNFWPKPVLPRGFGSASTYPFEAQSSGFQRYDQEFMKAPCGPPCAQNTSGYFFVTFASVSLLPAGVVPPAENVGGLMIHIWTCVPPAPANHTASGSAKASCEKRSSFTCVRGFAFFPPGEAV